MIQAPPLKYGRLRCSGNGFTCNSHTRAPPDVVKANLELAGNVSTQPRRDWWEAQVRLYGIECSTWTIEGMKTALRKQLKSCELRFTEKMERLEESYNGRYKKENEALQRHASNREPYHLCSHTETNLYNNDHSRLFWELKTLGGVKGLPLLNWRPRKAIHKEAERQSCFSKMAVGEILLVGAKKEDVVRQWNNMSQEAAAPQQELIEKRQQQQIAEQHEFDRLHEETIQTGNTNSAGKWILELDRRWRSQKKFQFMSIASPCDGSLWMSWKREVWHLDWIALDSEQKAFEWTRTDGVDGYDFKEDWHKGKGTITFESPYLLKGKSHLGDFTGRKVGNEISTTNEACVTKYEKAMEDIQAMKDKCEYWISSGTSKKDIMNELYSVDR